eukprot:SAG31_NODE_370_length_16651_cov_3.511056_12_plen_164_part_00
MPLAGLGDWKTDNSDKLNLSGILNVLDGVVDCPGRILVMTSNHPEMLDPALVRPGRVNLKLYLGYIQFPEAIQMIALYFSIDAMDAKHKDEVQQIWASAERGKGRFYTPAQLEQLCAECDSIAELLAALRRNNAESLQKTLSKIERSKSARLEVVHTSHGMIS